jgi:hypothetical protein
MAMTKYELTARIIETRPRYGPAISVVAPVDPAAPDGPALLTSPRVAMELNEVIGTQHVYHQLADVAVNVCVCGKWPMHHVHVGESRSTCWCDKCRQEVSHAGASA